MKHNKKWRTFFPAAALFFVFYYLYVWLVIEPRLIYYSFGRINPYSPFMMDTRFFLDSFTSASGPVAYLTGFLSQCFYFSWLGALIISLIAGLFWLLMEKILTATKADFLSWTSYIIPALLLASYSRYHDRLFNALCLLAALAAFVLYIRVNLQKNLFSILLFIIEFGCLYYIAGGIVLVFGILTGLYELFVLSRSTMARIIFAWLILYYVGLRHFNIPIMPFIVHVMDVVPFLIFLGVVIYRYIRNKKQPAAAETSPNQANPSKMLSFISAAGRILHWTFPMILMAIVFCLSFKKTDKLFFKMGYYSERQEWEKVLDCAADYPNHLYDIFCNHDINRALYHTGRLGDKMFSYHQTINALLIPDANVYPTLLRFSRMTDIFLELGYLGDAQRLACELLELTNQCPYTIKQLSLIHLVKGQKDTARIYLNALTKDLIYGRFARDLLERMDKDPDLNDYELVVYLRSVAVETDEASNTSDADAFFRYALEKNPRNKMAFEYMMAFYLLTGQLDKVAQNIHRLKDFSYDKMPRHLEEAMMIYTAVNQNPSNLSVNMDNFSPDSDTVQQFEKFGHEADALYTKTLDMQAVGRAMAKEFGGSYMYYLKFELPRARK